MIFLIGMPASGKSYWGKKISQEFQLPLADMDELIVQAEGNIAQLFEQKGDEYFRQKEKEILQHVVATYPFNTIVACGGGTPVYHSNITTMKANGCVVYLRADLDILSDRIADDVTRPLLASADKYQRLQQLFAEREEIYRQADYILQSGELSLPTFAKIIQECTNRH
ncbi:MAG: shikimate kinase [Sphingobacteriales bacterium]|nr:MAG: shikimate kinase [Sphingobacteriales bacterium]